MEFYESPITIALIVLLVVVSGLAVLDYIWSRNKLRKRMEKLIERWK